MVGAKRGSIDVHKDMMAHEDWPYVDEILKSIFTEDQREYIGNGVTRLYGTSEHFEAVGEDNTKHYSLWLKWEGGRIVLDKIKLES